MIQKIPYEVREEIPIVLDIDEDFYFFDFPSQEFYDEY
jgi:hypothetical protein